MRIALPKRRRWRALIYLLCLLLIATAIDLVLVQTRRTIHPGYDTTRVTEPRAAVGSVDLCAALDQRYADGATPDNNAAPHLLRALGRAALPANQPPDGITNRLGMPHLPEKSDYLT